MSNFSSVYQVYLTGYAGVDKGVGMPTTERLCQALALGVYHRTTSKPLLMSSVAVTAELRAMIEAMKTRGRGNLTLVSVNTSNKIGVIKVVRELTNLGLKEAKDLVDGVTGPSVYSRENILQGYEGGKPHVLFTGQPDRVEAAAKLLREAGCVVEVS